MAKYKVTYACGCTRIVQLFGPEAVQHISAEHLRKQRCPHCSGEILSISSQPEHPELPDLNGTPKQKSWAESIRMKAYEYHQTLCRKDTIYPGTTRKMVETLLKEKAAGWWINNRRHFLTLQTFYLYINSLLITN